MANYSKEFKLEAIKRAFEPEESVAQVASDLGVSVSSLHKWIHQYEEDGGKSFVGSGHLSPKDQQIRELQMKNKDLQEENDILKKAASYFAKNLK